VTSESKFSNRKKLLISLVLLSLLAMIATCGVGGVVGASKKAIRDE
jgi:Na+/serine symporter